MIQQPFYEGKLWHFRSLSMNISCPQIGIFGNPRKSCPQKCPVLHNRFCRTLNLRRIIGMSAVTMLKMYNMYHLYITLGRPFVCWEGFQLHLGYIHSHSIVLTIQRGNESSSEKPKKRNETRKNDNGHSCAFRVFN